jgi:hypothetical protein
MRGAGELLGPRLQPDARGALKRTRRSVGNIADLITDILSPCIKNRRPNVFRFYGEQGSVVKVNMPLAAEISTNTPLPTVWHRRRRPRSVRLTGELDNFVELGTEGMQAEGGMYIGHDTIGARVPQAIGRWAGVGGASRIIASNKRSRRTSGSSSALQCVPSIITGCRASFPCF